LGITVFPLHPGYPGRWRAWLSLYNPQTIGPLRQILEQFQPDVVHAHNIHLNLSYAALSTAHRLGFPTVFTSHDVMPFAYSKLTYGIGPNHRGAEAPLLYRLPRGYNLRQMRLRYNPLRNATIRRILRHHVQVCTCVSEAHRQALEANGLPPFQVIYNGLDPTEFDAPNLPIEALRTRFHLGGQRVILFAGRLTGHKGSEQALAALHQVVASVPNAVMLLLSGKPVETNNPGNAEIIQNHAHMGGWLSGAELVAAYQLTDVVILPSIIFESAGMVILEGMAARKPVVATCYGGPPELVVDGETGYIINPFDITTLADRLVRLFRDTALQQQMGEAGRRRLEVQFSLAEQVTHFLTVYHEAINDGAIGKSPVRV